MEKTSLMLIRVEEKNPNFVRFTTYGDRTGTVRTHFIQKNTTFDYDRMSIDNWYLINSQNVDNIWLWRMAFPIEIEDKIT
jgi:hypothetical protein